MHVWCPVIAEFAQRPADPCISERTYACILNLSNNLYKSDKRIRACATFFKRANQSGIILPCRQGDRKCSLIRGKRLIFITRSDSVHKRSDSGSKCRGCRYAKCIEIGMVKEDKDVKENNVCRIGYYGLARSVRAPHFACSLSSLTSERVRDMKRPFLAKPSLIT